MPTLLDDRLIDDALTALDGWQHERGGISRSVTVPSERVAALREGIDLSAGSLNHDPEIRQSGNQMTITLTTHDVGGVSELDIAMASRIDDLVLTALRVHRTAVGAIVADDSGAPAQHVVGEAAFPSEKSIPTTATETADEPRTRRRPRRS